MSTIEPTDRGGPPTASAVDRVVQEVIRLSLRDTWSPDDTAAQLRRRHHGRAEILAALDVLRCVPDVSPVDRRAMVTLRLVLRDQGDGPTHARR